jgi:hypothetical protein
MFFETGKALHEKNARVNNGAYSRNGFVALSYLDCMEDTGKADLFEALLFPQ